MEWFSKHVDTVIILTAFASSILWMNGKFNSLEKDIFNLEKDIAIVRTVLIVKQFMPNELAAKTIDPQN